MILELYRGSYASETDPMRYLILFTFFMLNLVLGANFLIAFIGWEGPPAGGGLERSPCGWI